MRPRANGGTWNREGVIVFAPIREGALARVSAAGGIPAAATALDRRRQETGHAWPQFLPDGRRFLYLALSGQRENRGLYVGSLGSEGPRRVLKTEVRSAYTPPGYLLFLQQGTLMAQRFNPDRLELTGEPVAVAEGVAYNSFNGRNTFSVSENGVLVYRTGRLGGLPTSELVWFDRGGKRIGSVGRTGYYLRPTLSRGRKTHRSGATRSPDGRPSIFGSSTRPSPPSCASRSVRPTRRTRFGRRTGIGSPSLPTEMARATCIRRTRAEPAARSCCFGPTRRNTSWTGLPTGDSSPMRARIRKQERIFGCCRFSEIANRFRFCKPGSTKAKGNSPRMDDGLLMSRMSREEERFTCRPSLLPAASGRSRLPAVPIRDGGATGRSSSMLPRARNSWRWRCRPIPRSGRVDPRCSSSSVFSSPIIPYTVPADGRRFLVNTPLEEDNSSPVTVVLNWTAELKKR